MSYYHDPEDHKYMQRLVAAAPEAGRALGVFDAAALRGPSKVIPRKYTELMALAVALTTQCPYCIEGHTKAAQREGATEQEIAETVATAAALRAGAAVAHGLMAMKFFAAAS